MTKRQTLFRLPLAAVLLVAGCARGGGATSVLAGSARETLAARTFRFVLQVDHDNAPAFVQSGMVDLERHLTWMGRGEVGEPEMILDGKTTYLLAELMPREFGATKPWVSTGPESDDKRPPPYAPYALQEAIPGAGMAGDPANLLEMISDQGGRVEQDGEELVRGVRSTRYRVVLDLKRLDEKVRSDSKARLERASTEDRSRFDDELRDALEHPPALRVWVGDDGLVRRTELKTSYEADEEAGTRQSEVTRMEFFDFGAPFTVHVPSASEAMDSLPGVRWLKDHPFVNPATELEHVSNWRVAGEGKVGRTRWILESGTSERGFVCTRLRLDPPLLIGSTPSGGFYEFPDPQGEIGEPPGLGAAPLPHVVPPVPPPPPAPVLAEGSVGGGCGSFSNHSGGGDGLSWMFGEVPPGADAARAHWPGGRVEAIELHGVAWAIVRETPPQALEFLRKGQILRQCNLESGMPGLC